MIHIPFRRDLIKHAIKTFDYDNYPLGGGLGIYTWESYVAWGLVRRLDQPSDWLKSAVLTMLITARTTRAR